MNDFRLRQVHLDYHTSPEIPGVGDAFDADAFGDRLAAAHVDSVTLFAKCHHGHLYYETKHPAKHPLLGCDLLTLQIEALRKRNIRCPIYLSVQCDEFAANEHPDWIALNPDGSHVGRKPLADTDATWQILDMASPYLDDLCAQTEEVLRRFSPVDGLFFDMCWDQVSVSKWAKAKMADWGLVPVLESDRKVYAQRLSQEYRERIHALVEAFQPGTPIWFNCRPMANLRDEQRLLKHVEIESLPTGPWGYQYFPIHARLIRPVGLPFLGMTGKFHKCWGDFGGLRTSASLMYDCVQALAHGAGCSIGDQLPPAGTLDAGTYEVIGEVYAQAKKCEPWCRETVAAREIAVLFATPDETNHADSIHEGVYRAFSRLRYQYAFLSAEDAFEEYSVLVVPESVSPDSALESRIAAFEKNGGKVVRELLSGLESSPYSVTYCRFERDSRGVLGRVNK